MQFFLQSGSKKFIQENEYRDTSPMDTSLQTINTAFSL